MYQSMCLSLTSMFLSLTLKCNRFQFLSSTFHNMCLTFLYKDVSNYAPFFKNMILYLALMMKMYKSIFPSKNLHIIFHKHVPVHVPVLQKLAHMIFHKHLQFIILPFRNMFLLIWYFINIYLYVHFPAL